MTYKDVQIIPVFNKYFILNSSEYYILGLKKKQGVIEKL